MKKVVCICALFFCGCVRHDDSLQYQVAKIAEDAKGIVGVSIENLESGDTLSYNGRYHCPMQSIFKFPIALAILSQVDKGTLSLEQKLHISKAALSDTTTWSPLRDKLTKNDTDLTIGEMLHYMVSQSDNLACDILLEKVGGPKQVEDFIHSIGVSGIAIAASEKEMHADNSLQYKSWCEPNEMTHLLKLFYADKCLSKTSTDYLMKAMVETATGAQRIKGLLPPGAIVAHKTDSSGSKDGFAPATNDAGIITLPNGKHLIVTVFVTDSKASDSTRDAVIAQIAKLAYDKMGSN